jgi:hypothetical protein
LAVMLFSCYDDAMRHQAYSNLCQHRMRELRISYVGQFEPFE